MADPSLSLTVYSKMKIGPIESRSGFQPTTQQVGRRQPSEPNKTLEPDSGNTCRAHAHAPVARKSIYLAKDRNVLNFSVFDIRVNIYFHLSSTLFFKITQHNSDTHNARTLTTMNTRTQTLPL